MRALLPWSVPASFGPSVPGRPQPAPLRRPHAPGV